MMSRKRRSGCLGCLPQLLLLFVGAGLVFLATIAVFAPWASSWREFSHSALLGRSGILHSKTGNSWFMRTSIHGLPAARFSGPVGRWNRSAVSPRGEIFACVSVAMRRGVGTNTDGEKIDLYMFYWPAFSGNLTGEHKPSVEFQGKWQNPKIVCRRSWQHLPCI